MKAKDLDIVFAWFWFDESKVGDKKIPEVNGKVRPCLVLESLMGGYRIAKITSKKVSLTGAAKKEAPFDEKEAGQIGLTKAGSIRMGERYLVNGDAITAVVGNISNSGDELLRRLHRAAKEAGLV